MQHIQTISTTLSLLSLVDYKNMIIKNSLYIAAGLSSLYLTLSYFNYSYKNKTKTDLYNKVKLIVQSEINKRNKKIIEDESKSKINIILKNAANQRSNINTDKNIFINQSNKQLNIEEVNQLNNNINNNNNNKLHNEKELNKDLDLKNKENLEFYYYVYYKCIKTIFKEEYKRFNNIHYNMFKKNETYEKLYNYINNFLNEIRPKEMHVLKLVYLELNTLEHIDFNILINDLDTKKISNIYYKDLDIELPKDLVPEKINEILTKLFEQTKVYFEKMNCIYNKNCIKFNDANSFKSFNIDNSCNNSNYNTEKLLLISEILAYDYIYHIYGYTEDQIRLSVILNDLDFNIISKENISVNN